MIIFLLLFLLFIFIYINNEQFIEMERDENIITLTNDTNNNLGDANANINELSYIDYSDDILDCYIYGCNKVITTNLIDFIGYDNFNKPIFNFENKYYSQETSNYFIKKNNNEIKTIFDRKISIPCLIDNEKIIPQIQLSYDDYTIDGYLTNNYYNINYIVYYKIINDNLNFDKLYEYILVKIKNKNYIKEYTLLPRQKIDNEETIWIQLGSIVLGPYKFISKL